MKTPTWGDIETFLKADGGWKLVRGTKHDFYEKALPTGEVLQTHVSRAKNKSMHADTFKRICELQLKVSVDAFWDTLRRGKPVRRPSASPPVPRGPTLQMVHQLRTQLHLSDEKLRRMTFEEAKKLLDAFYSRPR